MILARKTTLKEGKTEYYVLSFSLGLVAAGIGNISGAIFRVPYLLASEGDPIEFWFFGSFFFYIMMAIALTLVLSSGLAILRDKTAFYAGFISLLAIIPLVIAYTLPDDVKAVIGRADMEMSAFGAILVFGPIALSLLAAVAVYFRIYYQTRNYGSKMMFIGLIVILLSAINGSIGDIIAGDLGRYLDPFSYLFILLGLFMIYTGFKEK
ncbi:MAG: hypothetical protein ACTSP4_09555 [Candidatus Hodarchaeales archaeon]